MVSSQQLIALTLIQRAERWFETIKQQFKGIDLKPIFEELHLETEGLISIQQFRHRIETDTRKIYKFRHRIETDHYRLLSINFNRYCNNLFRLFDNTIS